MFTAMFCLDFEPKRPQLVAGEEGGQQWPRWSDPVPRARGETKGLRRPWQRLLPHDRHLRHKSMPGCCWLNGWIIYLSLCIADFKEKEADHVPIKAKRRIRQSRALPVRGSDQNAPFQEENPGASWLSRSRQAHPEKSPYQLWPRQVWSSYSMYVFF